ncbi:putative disease resistance RPP13-like protein 1 [Cannabis sativa]|uniref:putative disease resistance RPP13-like protein 1 n=1 Tax=Cannabis sativa TaxID=3483 RepID=UPI0011E05964|nr:putative disease resistance RPP13-like protein 1 [Cannabis sativa]
MACCGCEEIVSTILKQCLKLVLKICIEEINQNLIKPTCRFSAVTINLEASLLEVERKIIAAEKVQLQYIFKYLVNSSENESAEHVLKNWFPELKRFYYDMYDLVDKLRTAKLMSQMESEAASNNNVCCLKFHRLSLHRQIILAMKGLGVNSEQFMVDADKWAYDPNSVKESIWLLKEIPYSSEATDVIGRDSDKRILISKLENNVDNTTISIWGMGGVGKTALARDVYKDGYVTSKFDKMIWVSATNKYDLGPIMAAIMEALGQPAVFLEIENSVASFIEKVKRKKLFLVLDDVCLHLEGSAGLNPWRRLISAFMTSSPSSRILVTTQNYQVANMFGADRMIHLELLSENDCWSIINSVASLSDAEINSQSGDIRSELERKCSGSPLVASILANKLLGETTTQGWERVLQSEIGTKAFVPFLHNYYHLTRTQQLCFSYCSIFPKSYEIEREDVVELWMSQSYFRDMGPDGSSGLKCFNDLVDASLFQHCSRDYAGNIIKCKMHLLVYEFVQFLIDREHVERNDTLVLEALDHTLRPTPWKNVKTLRTLFVVPTIDRVNSAPPPLRCDVLVKLTCLRTLNMSHCNIKKLPDKIGDLVHLRYLNLSGNPLKKLPNGLCYLLNLQTLRLKGCKNLKMLPEKIGNLALNFCHLYIEGCQTLTALPKEIRKLTCLRVLDMFVVPSPEYLQNYEALMLEDLNQLPSIQGNCHIYWCGNLENVPAPRLSDIKFVSVKLNFEDSGQRRYEDHADEDILNTLQPHVGLMSLEIRGSRGLQYPNWINSLNCLRSIVLCGCRNWPTLPALGNLPSLVSLRIENMSRVANVNLQFLGTEYNSRGERSISFPKLKELHFASLPSWGTWETPNNRDRVVMPCLASLQLSDCVNLGELPDFLQRMTQLQHLTINNCTIVSQRCIAGPRVDWHKISHVPNIQIDGQTPNLCGNDPIGRPQRPPRSHRLVDIYHPIFIFISFLLFIFVFVSSQSRQIMLLLSNLFRL